MNFYSRLGIPETASLDDIRKAYYKKMLAIHPDRTSEQNTESSQEITAAWEILKDEQKRLEYDMKIKINKAALENHVFCEKITLEDCLSVNENEWIVECRCGGEYLITNNDIKRMSFSCSINVSLKHTSAIRLVKMDFFKIIDQNAEVSKKKELALKTLSMLTSNHEGTKQALVDFFNKRSLDKILELMDDRELQLSILQIALFRRNCIKLDFPQLRALFNNISAKNFNQTARHFLNALDSVSNRSKIKSIESKYIRFKQKKEIITVSGWIDFNENSIGLTTLTESEEVFTEIRYASISDWYMKVISVQDGSILIEIDLGQGYADILSLIINNMGRFSSFKRSETNNIIVLANFSGKKDKVIEKSKDSIKEIERIIGNLTKPSTLLRKELNVSNRKIKKVIKRKLKKRFLSHVAYFRDSVQELKLIPLSESLQIGKLCLSNCIKNILNE